MKNTRCKIIHVRLNEVEWQILKMRAINSKDTVSEIMRQCIKRIKPKL